ncbi:hypothetical protein HHK36_012594 [Tetracentron sinense]|uniref:Retrovirus-related Pol polyprotein from transposon TNT 1-94-like beta-barrel domain-containing protein n=1 Tax=Tetracentron sinense TaxID=13715 RepID=A0A834ZAM2_TETSI|nr:hypothetical protein HHK36_012594 [Tetracentron sinense]
MAAQSYTYPSTLNVGNFVSLRLTQTNYLLWRTQVTALIESQDMQGFLNGETLAPEPRIFTPDSTDADGKKEIPNPNFIAWKLSDRLLRGWITGTLSEDVLGLVVGLDTAANVWKALENAFAQHSKEREFQLTQQMSLLRKGKPVPDQNKVFSLLHGLGHGYETFVTTMLIPSYLDIVPMLQSHEARNQHHGSEGYTQPQMAYVSQRNWNQNKNNNFKKGNGQNRFNSKGRGFIQGGNSNGNRASGSVSFDIGNQHDGSSGQKDNQIRNQSQGKVEEQKDAIICQICNKRNHTALKCFNRFNHSFQADDIPQALAAFSIADNQNSEWFPDTGATAHMTGNPGKLQNLKPYKGNDGVMVGNGQTLAITHIGEAHINEKSTPIDLKNVLLVPEIKKDLLSVSQLTNDMPYTFEFNSDGFVIKDRRTNLVVAVGSRKEGLYALEGLVLSHSQTPSPAPSPHDPSIARDPPTDCGSSINYGPSPLDASGNHDSSLDYGPSPLAASADRDGPSTLDTSATIGPSNMDIMGIIDTQSKEAELSNSTPPSQIAPMDQSMQLIPNLSMHAPPSTFVQPSDSTLNGDHHIITRSKNGICKPNPRYANLHDTIPVEPKSVYDGMSEAKIPPDAYTFTNLIGALCKVGRVKEAKEVFFEMEKKGCSPSSVSYNVVIGGLCRAGALGEAFELKKSMAKKGLVLDNYTYTILINGFCKEKRSREAKLILAEMFEVGLKPENIPYTALIDGFMREGDIEEAFRARDEMVAFGIQPSLVTYNILIHGKQNMGRAFELLDEMKKRNLAPTVVTYGVIVNGLCRCGDFPRANGVLGEMIARCLKPNSIIYTTLISGHIREGRVEEARKVLEGLSEKGITPDTFCYNSLIIGLCKARKMEEARTYLLEMVKRGLIPNDYTYGAFIHGYSKIGAMQDADRYLSEMLGRGLVPNDVIYTALIDGHCKAGNITEAFSTIHSMLGRGMLLDVQMYSVLIHGLSRNGKIQEAMGVFSELLEKGLVPDVFTYSSLISGFYDVEGARKLFDGISGKGLAPNGVTYTTMIDGYCKSGNVTEAFRLFSEMPSRGVQPDSFVYRALVNGCCKEGKMKQALDLFHELVQKGSTL